MLIPTIWRSDYKVLEKITEANASISTRKTFVVEAGKAGVQEA